MFAWFQRLLPRKGDFFGMFEAHAATLVAAADALKRLADDGASTGEILRVIRDREHEADEVIRQVLTEVRMTFLAPFDRGAITSLIVAMDDTIDEMLAAARAIDLYELREALEVYVIAKVTREQLPGEDIKRLEQLSDGILSLVDELEATGESYLNTEQMQRFIAADRGFHTLLMAFSFNPRIRKIVDDTRLLIRIFAMRRLGYDAGKLRKIHAQHAAIIEAIMSKDSELAMHRLAQHIQISRQERLDEFDRNRRASTIERSYSDLNL